MLYWDSSATTPMTDSVLKAMWPYMTATFANPSSIHDPGKTAAGALAWAHTRIGAALGARPDEVILTGSGTEADNLGVQGLSLANPRGRRIVTTAAEHPAIRESCRFMQRFLGYTVDPAPVDHDGLINQQAMAALIRPDTTLVALSLANGEVGTLQDCTPVVAAAHAAGALVLVDAIQAVDSMPLDFDAMGVDAMAVGAHKVHGPKGVGALLLREGTRCEPLIHGGGQERGLRSGTENVAGAVGFAKALSDWRTRECADGGYRHRLLRAGRDALFAAVGRAIPQARITGHRTRRLDGHASWIVPGFSGEYLVLALQEAGFAISSGTACAARLSEASRTLLAMGYTRDEALGAIRVTFDEPPVQADIHRFADALARVVFDARA